MTDTMHLGLPFIEDSQAQQRSFLYILQGFMGLGLIVGVALVQGVFSYLQRMILVGMSRDIEFELRNQYFSGLETQPPAFFHDHPTGDLMARAGVKYAIGRESVGTICAC